LPDGSAVLFDPRTEMAYPLTPTAAIVWETCDGDHTDAAMVEEIGTIFDAPADVIERDVASLLARLSEIGLLETPAGAGV
jgi:hypothetical protein